MQKIFEKLKGREEIDTQKFSTLSTFALKSISNVTRVFKLLERDKTLWIIVDPAVQANSEDKTVYVVIIIILKAKITSIQLSTDCKTCQVVLIG